MKVARTKVKPIFFGLDIMVRGCGIIGIDQSGHILVKKVLQCPYKGMQRVNFYFEKFYDLIAQYPHAYYGIEDYAYGKGGSNSRSTFTLGEITGTYKLHLYRTNLPTFVFGIGQIKKFFVGKGNAGKLALIERYCDIWNLAVPTKVKDQDYISHLADAYAISLMTRYYATGNTTGLNTSQIEWLEAHSGREFELR